MGLMIKMSLYQRTIPIYDSDRRIHANEEDGIVKIMNRLRSVKKIENDLLGLNDWTYKDN